MARIARCLLGVCGALLAAGALPAQNPPFGNEFRVNEHTTGTQVSAGIAANSDGTFVIVWESYGVATDYGVRAQRFDGSGVKSGPEISVDNLVTLAPSVSADPAGDFVVAWEADNDGYAYGIAAQKFDHAGNLLGSRLAVNDFKKGLQAFPSPEMDAAGNFVIVWASPTDSAAADFETFGRRFDSAGTKLGSEFRVNTYTTGDQSRARIAVDPAGGFLVVWESDDQDGSSKGVFGQRFDSLGAPQGAEFRVNAYTTGAQAAPSIASDRRGNFVVVWVSPQDGDGYGIRGQRFNVAGEPVGAEFAVNTYTTGNQVGAVAAFDPTGGFGVVWQSDGQDGSEFGVFGQRFDRAGSKVGTEFPVNTYTTDTQGGASLAIDGRGSWILAWSSFGQDGDNFGLYRRRNNLLPRPLAVDAHTTSATVSDGDGVLEPGETVIVEPAWHNVSNVTIALTSAASHFGGPPGGTYVLLDSLSNFGSIPSGAIHGCYDTTASHPCARVSVGGARPAAHWDAQFEEDVSTNGGQIWSLHVGDSFTDVPRTEPFYRRIETLLHAGITSGCTATTYCPGANVLRSDMAIFVAKAIAGTGPNVPTTGRLFGSDYACKTGGVSLFSDVFPTDIFCKHVHYLALEKVTLGCNANQYCPALPVNRAGMASFIAKAIVAPAGGAAVPLVYGPDPNTGLSYSCDAMSPNTHFTDVPASHPFCRHIHFLWAKGIVSGCSATQFCPGQSVHRDAMAKFIANGFGLELYPP